MKSYKVVMLGTNEYNDIIMGNDLTKEEAIKIKEKCEAKDNFHYFEIKEV